MVRYLIKFTKESNIKFISHLDMQRTLHKIIRRANLPIKYSKGFNPHMATSIAQPLSVGVYSDGEYMDIILVEEIEEDEVVERLNQYSVPGIKFKDAKKIIQIENEKKVPQGMALIDACRYTVKIKYSDTSNLSNEMDKLIAMNEGWVTIKKSKKGEKEVDIKPMIYEIKYWIKDNILIINMLIQSGSRMHLSADLVCDYIKEKTTNAIEDSFVEIKREEMYFLRDGKYYPLYNIV